MNDLIKQKIELIAKCIFDKIQKSAQEEESYGLYSGKFGILLFLFYYSDYSRCEKSRLLTENYAERLLNHLLMRVKMHSFCNGFSGILYLFEFLRENDFIDLDLGNSYSFLEHYLIMCMRDNINESYYDFMHGALGVGLYYQKRETNIKYTDELIDFLYQTAEKENVKHVFKWKSLIERERNFVGYNLSLSHGISSIIVFLSRVVNSGRQNGIIMEMLYGGVNYVLSQQKNFPQFGYYFPSYILTNSNEVVPKSRLAWCYGDLGIGIALWQAGKTTDNKEWKDKGLEILLQSTKRILLSDTFVKEAGICHGAAGIALIYRRMYLETTLNEFKEATDFWIRQTLNFSIFEDGLAGFKSYFTKDEWICDYSLLTGISGIGLVLMSYLLNDSQEWDETLLLS